MEKYCTRIGICSGSSSIPINSNGNCECSVCGKQIKNYKSDIDIINTDFKTEFDDVPGYLSKKETDELRQKAINVKFP